MPFGPGAPLEDHLVSGTYFKISETLQLSSEHSLSSVLVLMFFPERNRWIESGVIPYPIN